jgi:hypothetical protein
MSKGLIPAERMHAYMHACSEHFVKTEWATERKPSNAVKFPPTQVLYVVQLSFELRWPGRTNFDFLLDNVLENNAI